MFLHLQDAWIHQHLTMPMSYPYDLILIHKIRIFKTMYVWIKCNQANMVGTVLTWRKSSHRPNAPWVMGHGTNAFNQERIHVCNIYLFFQNYREKSSHRNYSFRGKQFFFFVLWLLFPDETVYFKKHLENLMIQLLQIFLQFFLVFQKLYLSFSSKVSWKSK